MTTPIDQLDPSLQFAAARTSVSLPRILSSYGRAFEILDDQESRAAFLFHGQRYFVDIVANTFYPEGSPDQTQDGYALWLLLTGNADSSDNQTAYVQFALGVVDYRVIDDGDWRLAL